MALELDLIHTLNICSNPTYYSERRKTIPCSMNPTVLSNNTCEEGKTQHILKVQTSWAITRWIDYANLSRY